ncbi:hypothetical protein IMG5_061210 [Ichthyophthirius multifiliis]|uniref:Transmembrane protein n=1 Tax=Ichthyophthirius multifiliis TaxID=5932 RepID=G0QNT1_ICHMU|nr:hypothetical protein IMG5_061210 [Ichthyophthirius multifiliis]EGR33122.1 hypothetical protein IMG5_061210 [Ichthyophthirius multifiliis]|eukprot:XP_004037108.1 hypothetical protein IMG5_061210 [Ichthyophthirius multifiliis]
MDNYFTAITLLGLRDQNLPPFKDARLQRYKSIKKMIDLIETATKLYPKMPIELFTLNPTDPEWDDDMTYPSIQYSTLLYKSTALAGNLFLYAYNYNNYTSNIRFRTMRYFFPIVSFAIFGNIYWDYRSQLTRVNLFDEYVQLRSQELVKQNEYLLEHEDIKRYVWWNEDLKETLLRVHRQANNHQSSDFQDSELILQDFIDRYSDSKNISFLSK